MPHICHITTGHPPFDTRIFRHECVSLARAGFRVTLIAQHDRAEVVNGVEVLPLPKLGFGLKQRFRVVPAAIRAARATGADLFHFHDPELLPAMHWLARRTSRPVIWDAHENYVTTIPHLNSMRFAALSAVTARFFDWAEIRACTRAFAGVVTITDVMERRYLAHGIRTCAVGNMPELDQIPFPPRVKRAAQPRFVSSGLQFTDRAVLEIADAFRMVRRDLPCQVAFWGNFSPPELAEQLRVLAQSDQCPPADVLVGGPYPWATLVGELVPTAWAGCALLNPELEDNRIGLPNRFLEYWASAVPVITTAGTEVARVVQEEGGGLVLDENTPEAIAGAFRHLALHPEQVEEMGAAGRAAVERRYNWGHALENLVDFYAEIGLSPVQPTHPGEALS